jgi:hypothetical protein
LDLSNLLTSGLPTNRGISSTNIVFLVHENGAGENHLPFIEIQ